MVKRFDIWLLNLDKTGTNTRPCLVVSPDEMNRHLPYLIIAPITSENKKYPTRVSCQILEKERFIMLDQLQTRDRETLQQKIGEAQEIVRKNVLNVLQEMFSE
jgi:mRNA interferase MazF